MANNMWKDSESEVDYLKFNYLSEQVIEISKDENLSPATIGVWVHVSCGPRNRRQVLSISK